MASPCAVVTLVAAPENATEAVRRCLHLRAAPSRAQHCVLHVHGALNAVQLADELDTDLVAAAVLRLHPGGRAIPNEHRVDPAIGLPTVAASAPASAANAINAGAAPSPKPHDQTGER